MKQPNVNGLTNGEQERLAILVEECFGVIKAVTKILRHGYESSDPTRPTTLPITNNREDLQRECGDVRAAMINMCDVGDMSKPHVHARATHKLESRMEWTHHQEGSNET